MLRQSLGYLRIFHKRPKEKNQDSERVSNATPIIFNLPYDIMESVWLYLPMVDRLKCTQVCQLWRSQLLGSTVMWSEISGNISHCLKPYKINGSDIHQVDLERDPDGIDFLLNLKCSNLQSISGAHIRDGNVLMSFHELLCFTGLALRSLSVKAGTPFEDVLSLIFMQCSGLTHLRFIAKRSHPYRISSNYTITAESPIANAMKQVADLDLYFFNINEYPVKRILRLFTGVKNICIASNFLSNHDWLPWLDETFPGWQSIRLGNVPTEEKPHTEFQEQGCRTFACGLGWFTDMVEFENFLKNYGGVMTAFHMASAFTPSQKCDIVRDYLINTGIPSQLCSLVLDGGHTLVYGFSLEEILDELPRLQQLVLSRICFDGIITNEEQLFPLEQLGRSLKIVKITECFGMESQRLHRLARRFHSCMQLVWFNCIDLVPREYLDSVADNVSSLDSLVMAHMNLTNDHLLSFAERWKGKRLNTLRFRAVESIKSPRRLQGQIGGVLKNTDVTFY